MAKKDLLRKPKDLPEIKRIKTGVFSIDALTGGGIPVNKITIFEGAKSSGKTTVALKTIGNFLRMYKDKQVLYIDLEESFDNEWVANFVEPNDMDRILVLSEVMYGEQVIDFIIEVLKSEDYNIGLLMIDSIANFIPIADADKSAMEDTVGTLARVVNKFFRKILPIKTHYAKTGRDLTILLINQIRVKIGNVAFTSGYTKPGGSYQDFLAHLDIRFYTIGEETFNMGHDKSNNIIVKTKHQFRIEKAKLAGAVPKMKGEFKLVLIDHDIFKAGDTDDYNYIINAARKYGALSRDGNKWKWFGREFKNKNEILQTLIKDKKFFQDMYDYTVRIVSEKKFMEIEE